MSGLTKIIYKTLKHKESLLEESIEKERIKNEIDNSNSCKRDIHESRKLFRKIYSFIIIAFVALVYTITYYYKNMQTHYLVQMVESKSMEIQNMSIPYTEKMVMINDFREKIYDTIAVNNILTGFLLISVIFVMVMFITILEKYHLSSTYLNEDKCNIN